MWLNISHADKKHLQNWVQSAHPFTKSILAQLEIRPVSLVALKPN